MNDETSKSLVSFIDRAEEKFEMAPSWINFEAEKSFALQILDANEGLMETARNNPKTLLGAIANIAAIGLSLNPAKQQAYLIPRGGRVLLEPSYRGLCDILTGTGCVEWLQSEVVYESDTFELNGIDKEPTHKRSPFAADRGKFVGAYCVAKLPSGEYLTTTMSAEELNKIQTKSTSPAWKQWPDEQRKKCVVRRAFKMLPKSHVDKDAESLMANAVDLSNHNEGITMAVSNPDYASHTPEQKEYLNQLIEKDDALGMAIFMGDLSEGIQISLYNSFEKGKITEYKKLVSGMTQRGFATLRDLIEVAETAAVSGDEYSAREELEDLPQDVLNYIFDNIDTEARRWLGTILEVQEEA